MKTLALLSIWLALPLAAQELKTNLSGDPGREPYCADKTGLLKKGECPGVKSDQTLLTPEEHDSYVLMVIQDLSFNLALETKLRTHKAGNDDIENRDGAHAERMNALKQLIQKHNACEGGDWNIAKKEWSCPALKEKAKE